MSIFLSPSSPWIMIFKSSMRFFTSIFLITVQRGRFLCSLCMCIYVHGMMWLELIIRTSWYPLVLQGLFLIQSVTSAPYVHGMMWLELIIRTSWYPLVLQGLFLIQSVTSSPVSPHKEVVHMVFSPHRSIPASFTKRFTLWTRHFQIN